jgi:hypothetical protein
MTAGHQPDPQICSRAPSRIVFRARASVFTQVAACGTRRELAEVGRSTSGNLARFAWLQTPQLRDPAANDMLTPLLEDSHGGEHGTQR